jgi:hypothetical protein
MLKITNVTVNLLYPARGCQYNLAVFELRLDEGNERNGESESSRYLLSLVYLASIAWFVVRVVLSLFCPHFYVVFTSPRTSSRAAGYW